MSGSRVCTKRFPALLLFVALALAAQVVTGCARPSPETVAAAERFEREIASAALPGVRTTDVKVHGNKGGGGDRVAVVVTMRPEASDTDVIRVGATLGEYGARQDFRAGYTIRQPNGRSLFRSSPESEFHLASLDTPAAVLTAGVPLWREVRDVFRVPVHAEYPDNSARTRFTVMLPEETDPLVAFSRIAELPAAHDDGYTWYLKQEPGSRVFMSHGLPGPQVTALWETFDSAVAGVEPSGAALLRLIAYEHMLEVQVNVDFSDASPQAVPPDQFTPDEYWELVGPIAEAHLQALHDTGQPFLYRLNRGGSHETLEVFPVMRITSTGCVPEESFRAPWNEVAYELYARMSGDASLECP
ncbi:hypothetical protein ONR57_01435 [Hoyosella sp. YIM 151337]|nr:hypothetical protein [Hoyosella sp. YIM 151337]MCW4351962.1 hypothetical protein [Hoyosella sp. YIM 151337]